jgi:hypothetical protein
VYDFFQLVLLVATYAQHFVPDNIFGIPGHNAA